tara:strand:- start:179 stop:346 length:168 start_codon:yes stop_codon:yes gene_type:complete
MDIHQLLGSLVVAVVLVVEVLTRQDLRGELLVMDSYSHHLTHQSLSHLVILGILL